MSTLRTNALEGMDAKNSITIVAGAGNITTTNVQEGLCKLIAKSNQSSNEIEFGFNTSSYTDSATGLYILTATSVFSSVVNLVSTSSSQPQATSNHCINHMAEGSSTSSAIKFSTVENGSNKDQPFNHNTVFGDLA